MHLPNRGFRENAIPANYWADAGATDLFVPSGGANAYAKT